MSRVRRSGDGLQLTLRADEVELLRHLGGELRDVLGASGDPALDRLFPTAYLDPTEEDAEAEWQDMVRPTLLQGRLEAMDTVAGALEGEHRGKVTLGLGPDDVAAWLGVVNDLRLTLGVRLELTDDFDWRSIREDDPRAPAFVVYDWLTHLQGDLLGALGYA